MLPILVLFFCTSLSNASKVFDLWEKYPAMAVLNTTMLQPKCRRAFDDLLQGVNNYDLDALKMLDATGKLPSGILSGNVNQYGDFDECMAVKSAQYCLVEIDLDPVWKTPYSRHRDLVHSFYAFKESFNDPGHRVPGFTMVRWGFCIPRECSAEDLKTSLRENFGVLSRIRPGMCQLAVKPAEPSSLGYEIAKIFFMVVISAVIAATIIDFMNSKVSKYDHSISLILKILMCFSLKRNAAELLKLKEDTSDEIAGLHGIRCLSAFALLMSHKSISLFFNPYINRTYTINRLSRPWTIIAKNAIIYTDCFILLSGLLNANALLTDLIAKNSMKFKEKLINRIFRILPNVIALILFCTYILPSWGAGPLWPTVVTHHSDLCKKYMWRNILFIHNYFGFENMCLTHTHQIGIDMQLFLMTPPLVYLIWRSKRLGLFVLSVLALASTVLRFWVFYQNELSSVVYFGISISKMFKTANLSYILPTHRATVYLIGVYMAYLLKFSKPTTPLSKLQLTCLWLLLIGPFLGSWFGPYHMALRGYTYNKLETALIASLSPVLWGVSVSFGIYVFNKKIAGWLGVLFCWKYFQIGTKIAYAIYLVQFPVYFYNVGITKHIDEYQSYFQLQIFETAAIIIASVILVLVVEMPFQNVRKVLFSKNSSKQNSKQLNETPLFDKRKAKTG